MHYRLGRPVYSGTIPLLLGILVGIAIGLLTVGW